MDAGDWDEHAASFDEEVDHGLTTPQARAAWRTVLSAALPPAPARVADLGCGTGTLSRLLVDAGHSVDGVDYSPAMLQRARAKVPESSFIVGDAADPPLTDSSYDVVLCRHVLWALPDPAAALARWHRLLRPSGRLVLVEGSWDTGAGLTAADTEALVRTTCAEVRTTPLRDAALWGREISDERYLVVGGGRLP